MALSPMAISDLFTKIRYTLQDTASNRWTNDEMYVYLDDAVRDIAQRSMYYRISQDISIVEGNPTYQFTKELLKFHSIDTTQTYEITDATTITFEDSAAEDVTVEYYAYPDRITSSDTHVTLEQDMYDMVRWFILARCYEKEDSTVQFEKSRYFMQRYLDYMSQNLTRWHGNLDVTLSRNDYYSGSTSTSSPLNN